MEKALTFRELRAHLRVSPPVLYDALRKGRIRATKIGRAWRITESAVAEFLRGGGDARADKTEE